MANYWTFQTNKDEDAEGMTTARPWENAVSHGNQYEPRQRVMSMAELSKARYSVRDYDSKPVPQKTLEYILECTRMAPSAVNKQPWHFYVCRTPDTLGKVCQTYRGEWLQTAPMIIVCCICHDEEWVRKIDGHPHGVVDISIAAEHICLAATEQGLGTCWVCNFDASLCQQLLNLPENQEPAVLIPIGFAKSDDTPEKTRKDMKDIVTFLE